MKRKCLFLSLSFFCLVSLAQPKLTVDVSKKGAKISPTHYGIFFEDINHAADGGLYAELIRNRSFEDASVPDNWTQLADVDAAVRLSIETHDLLNDKQSRCLKMIIMHATPKTRAGVSNSGFWGINIVKGRKYKLSFYAKFIDFTGPVMASLESKSGVKYANVDIKSVGSGWNKYTCIMIANGNDPEGRFVISSHYSGTLLLDVVSLFPPTFKNRENGLRPELAQLLVDMKPKFMRFPGGCFVEGDTLVNRFEWKKTIGKIEERPGHKNLWGYRTSDGMGFHEFLLLAEDLHTEPLYVINVGIAHKDFTDYTNNDDYLQDALDALEYANGSVTTKYGAMRAANGHPQPFNIKYIEIGNENDKGNNYGKRYEQFYKAIKEKYPQMLCIGNVAAWGTDNPTWKHPTAADFLDEHYYRNPQWFVNQYEKYDSYNRNGYKIYVGEYAVTKDCGLGNLNAAVGEAVYMAGMEKNSDIVPMNSYAPIFVNVNDRKWSPDMINYNASLVYCTPSYYVQKLFATNVGTVNVAVNDSLCKNTKPISGAVGLGTWETTVDYSNVNVTNRSGKTLFSDSFSDQVNWTSISGIWNVSGGVLSQTSTVKNSLSIAKSISDSVYTYTVKARKIAGKEGFMIVFGYKDAKNYYRWNIGGWANTKHGIERCIDGVTTTITTTNGSVALNQWYSIRIEVAKSKVLCYLDDVLIHSFSNENRLLYTSATLDEATNQLYLKVMNPNNEDVTSVIDLKSYIKSGVGTKAEVTTLTSANGLDENSISEPNKVVPVTHEIKIAEPAFMYNFKANSVNIIKLTSTLRKIKSKKK
ncbi:MAG: alpha-L-arabinofuranosidase C-terminal domain-containing protein [Paludibacter sp.]|nr:alpha-L-arabinofuranosidase C-terminal domain-containing protein [Paludibacter sp.]